MKKLYINGKFLAQATSGVQRFALGVIRALDRNLQLNPSSYVVELLLPSGATFIPGLNVITQSKVGPPQLPLFMWEQGVLPAYAISGTLLCLTGSAPFFVRSCLPTIHDAAIYRFPSAYTRGFVLWYKVLFRRLARRSQFVFTVSKFSESEILSYLAPAETCIIPNSAEHILEQPSDRSIFTELGIARGKYLLAVGSLNPTKNFPALIKEYTASTISENMPLVIVGSKNQRVFGEGGNFIKQPNTKWAGNITDAKLRALYEGSVAFIFPSLYEGFGIPPLEAMQCGCPVIASNLPSVLEVCGDAATYFTANDMCTMTDAIVAVLTNDQKREDMILRGRERAQRFSWAISAERLRRALDKVLA